MFVVRIQMISSHLSELALCASKLSSELTLVYGIVLRKSVLASHIAFNFSLWLELFIGMAEAVEQQHQTTQNATRVVALDVLLSLEHHLEQLMASPFRTSARTGVPCC